MNNPESNKLKEKESDKTMQEKQQPGGDTKMDKEQEAMQNKENGGSQEKSGGNQNKGPDKQESKEGHTPDGEKGCGYFPISDQEFDVVCVVYEKSKALQAYDKYLRDCQSNEELRSIFEKIKEDDRSHIEALKKHLGKCA